MLVRIYQTTWRHIYEDSNLYIRHRDSLTVHKKINIFRETGILRCLQEYKPIVGPYVEILSRFILFRTQSLH